MVIACTIQFVSPISLALERTTFFGMLLRMGAIFVWVVLSAAHPLQHEHTLGPAITLGRLTLFPIYAHAIAASPLRIISLDEALATGVAVVRERRGEGANAPDMRNVANAPPIEPNVVREPVQQQVQQVAGPGGGARVNEVVIENNGTLQVLVLAGTIIKGGKQDRQVGEDFVIAPKTEVPIGAFCVEAGRWNQQRAGKDTGEKFSTLNQLTPAAVRKAGQFEQDQRQVWAKVDEQNKALGVAPESKTLLASVENEKLRAAQSLVRDGLVRELAALDGAERIVGVAYGVEGQIRDVRWFADAPLYRRFADTLLNTASSEAALAELAAKSTSAATLDPADVTSLVAQAWRAQAVARPFAEAANVNVHRRSETVLSSECKLKDDNATVTVDVMPAG